MGPFFCDSFSLATEMNDNDELNISASAAAALAPVVSAASVKLPEFYAADPHFWVRQAEAQFTLKGITSSLTKYFHLLASIPADVSSLVRDVVQETPAENPYEVLRDRLLQALSLIHI